MQSSIKLMNILYNSKVGHFGTLIHHVSFTLKVLLKNAMDQCLESTMLVTHAADFPEGHLSNCQTTAICLPWMDNCSSMSLTSKGS